MTGATTAATPTSAGTPTTPAAASNPDFMTCTFATDGMADTSGWDTVYAVRVPIINQALTDYFASQKGGGIAFSETMGTGISASGTFGAWQVTTGGSGPNIRLSLPISTGTASIPGITTPVSLDGVSLIVECNLGYHPVPAATPATPAAGTPAATTSAVSAQLKVNLTNAPATTNAAGLDTVQTSGPAPTAGAASPVSVLSLQGAVFATLGAMETMAQTFVQGMLTTWLTANLSIFDVVLLSVDIATEIPAGSSFGWVTPTYVGYAVADLLDAGGQPTGIENSVFAFLAMTQNNPPSNVTSAVSVNAIPNNPGVNAGFLIAPYLIPSQIFEPSLPGLFQNSTAADFVIQSDGMTIINQNPLTMQLQLDPSWYVGLNNPVTATIPANQFSLQIQDSQVSQSFLNISFPYGLQSEVTVQMALTSTSTLGLDQNKHFAMQYGNTDTCSLNISEDAEKAAWEALEGIGVNLAVTALCCFAGFGGAGDDAGALKPTTPGGGTVEPIEPDDPAGSGAKGDTGLDSDQNSAATKIEAEVTSTGSTGGNPVDLPVNGATETVSPENLDSDVAQSGVQEMENPSTWTLKGIMPRFTFKIWAMFVGQFASSLYSDMGDVDQIRAYQQTPSSVPGLQDFTDECVSGLVWPATPDATLVCAGLNGAFTLGLTVS